MADLPLPYNQYWKRLIFFAAPIALQNLLFTLLNMLDLFMIGQLGESSIAAVGLCNQINFILSLFLFGISSGGSIFIAQYWGKGDRQGIWDAQAMSLLLAAGGTLLVFLFCQIFPRSVLGLFTTDDSVLDLGVRFLRISSWGYFFNALVIIYRNSIRSTGQVRLPMMASVIALSTNGLFNYLLIFGKAGFPRLGITGAAIATVGARILEAAIILYWTYKKKSPSAMPVSAILQLKAAFVTRYMKRTSPVILNEIGWATGVAMYTLVMARIGTSAVAAFNVSENVSRLALVAFIGLANGAAILLGNRIGAGEQKQVLQFTRRLMAVVPLFTLALALPLFFIAPLVPALFRISSEASQLVVSFMRVFSLALIFKTSNLMIIVGVLRSGGDTTYSMIMDVAFLWLFSVPLVLLTGLLLRWPPQLVYMVAMTEEVIKYFFGIVRVLRGRWVKDVTQD